MKTLRLRVPSPVRLERLDRFLAGQVPELSRRAARGLVDAGQVRVDGRLERSSGRRLQSGQDVELRYRPGRIAPACIDASNILARGDGWIALHKPAGLPTHRSDEGGIGVPERLTALQEGSFKPAHRLDRGTSGVLLVATDDENAAAWSQRFADRAVKKTYRAIVSPAPHREDGVEQGEDMELSWRLLRRSRDGRRAELEVRPREGRTHQIRRQLATAGHPIVGDVEHGRCVPGGASRMALHCASLVSDGLDVSCEPPEGWDGLLDAPAEKPAPAPRATSLPTLSVSSATARVLRGGHPWVVADRDTGDVRRFKPGDLAQLVDPRGKPVAVAVVDPGSAICARVVGQDARADWAGRTRKALRRRKGLLADPSTNALRLIHGEADGIPGLTVDLWATHAVATISCEAARAYAPAVYEALRDGLELDGLWEQDHLADLRKRGAPRDAALPGRSIFGEVPEQMDVTERGLSFLVEPRAGLTTGLYTDQRENRARCAPLAEGGTIANLFAHTGAFSVALAAAGAERVFAVDLGQRYLRWAAQNLERNGLDPEQHPGVAADAIEWLRHDAPPLDGAILDPPSHARRRGRNARDWNARRDYSDLVAAAAGRLKPGGWLLCCVNLKGTKGRWLPERVRSGAQAAGRRVLSTEPAGPSMDHPRRRGFPEGVAFVGLLAKLE